MNYEDFEKLKKILSQLKLEYICIYTRNYNILKRAEASKELTGQMLIQLMALVKKEMAAKKLKVLEFHKNNGLEDKNMTIEKFDDWINFHGEDPFVIEMKECIKNLNDEVFTKKQMSHFDFSKDIPAKFTQDSYFKTFEMVWAAIRHEIWKEVT